MNQWKPRSGVSVGVQIKDEWFYVTILDVRCNGFTWIVCNWMKFPQENGIVQDVPMINTGYTEAFIINY